MAKVFMTAVTVLIMAIVTDCNRCSEGQVERPDLHNPKRKICCYPTECQESQQFVLCTANNGKDYCKSCPAGTYTNDKIQTLDWTEQISICVKKPTCSDIDTIILGGKCICNKLNGYYGTDTNNCRLDNKNCKEAGHELDDDGACVECEEEFFKPVEGEYGVCRQKTSNRDDFKNSQVESSSRCRPHQVEVHPGSSKADRSCRKRTADDPPPPTPPTTDQTDKGSNSTRTNGDRSIFDNMFFWLFGVILSSLLIVSTSAILIYVFRKKWCCAAFLKVFKVGRHYAPVPPVENGSERGHTTTRNSREEDHELTSITNLDSSLDSSKSSSNSSKDHETTCTKYRITEVIVELDENETSAKTVAMETKPVEETVVKSVSGEVESGQPVVDLDSTSLKVRLDQKDTGMGQSRKLHDAETTVVKKLQGESPEHNLVTMDTDISITKVKRNLAKESSNASITKFKRHLPADEGDVSITKVKRLNESETRPKRFGESESRTPQSYHKERGFLDKSKKGQSVDLQWPKFRNKNTQETSFSLPSTPKKSNMFGAKSKESDRPTLKVEPFSRRQSPRNSKLVGESYMASAAIDDSFKTVPMEISQPLFSDSLGFYSCEDEGNDPLNVAQLQQRHNHRATLPATVFVTETELGNGKDSNGRVRSLPIISQEGAEKTDDGNVSYWQQMALHGLESDPKSKVEGHNIINPSVHLSQRQNAITHTSKSNEEVHTSTCRIEPSEPTQARLESAVIGSGEQISFDPLSTLDASSIMNETQESITPSNPLISIPRPHEVLPPPEPIFDDTIVVALSSGSSEEAVSEGATSEGAASEGSANSVVMPLLEGSSSTGSGSSRKRTLSRSLSMEEENKDSSSSTEKSMG